MSNQSASKQKKKKNSGGLLGLIIVAFIWAMRNFDFSDLRYFWARLRWMLRTGRFPVDGETFGLICGAAVLAVVVLFVAVRASRAAKEKRFTGVTRKPGTASGGGTAAAHSHDRLQGYAGNESGAEHWKKQLDGFLAAGIIERDEYRILLERRRK